VKKKTMGQLVVKERQRSMMATSKRGQQRQVGRRLRGEKRKGGYRRKPLERKGASFYFFTKVICK
jgi:hypothetical protein